MMFGDLNEVIGRSAFTYGALFAFIPVIPLVAIFLWLDRLRPEPTGLIVVALLWGALIATYAALRLNGWLAGEVGDQYGGSPRSAVFVAPWVEETAKSAVIFAIVWWRRHDFNSVTAGVIVGGLSGIGFAFTENIVYYGQVFQQTLTFRGENAVALDAVRELFWWRGVAAPFVHPMFTMVTGLGIGIAVRHRHIGVRILAPAAAFCAAVLLHMGYNTAASFAVNGALTPVYVGILLPTLLAIAVVVGLVRRHERLVIAARLLDYTAFGWIKADQIPYIVTWRGRRQSRRYARGFGRAERDRVRAFQRAGVDLGVLRDRLVRGVAGEAELPREQNLLAAMRALRGRVLLPGISDLPLEDVTARRSSW